MVLADVQEHWTIAVGVVGCLSSCLRTLSLFFYQGLITVRPGHWQENVGIEFWEIWFPREHSWFLFYWDIFWYLLQTERRLLWKNIARFLNESRLSKICWLFGTLTGSWTRTWWTWAARTWTGARRGRGRGGRTFLFFVLDINKASFLLFSLFWFSWISSIYSIFRSARRRGPWTEAGTWRGRRSFSWFLFVIFSD